MAYCDYMHCAVCDCKVHYDGSVDYDDYERGCEPVVLCKDCMKTHEIIIQEIEVKDEKE
jgi:hypothetical protein